jgi:hypothetical protein
MSIYGSTVLPNASQNKRGTFSAYIWGTRNSGTVRVTLWATSASSTLFPAGCYNTNPSWYKVGDMSPSVTLSPYQFTMNINNSHFNGAKSVALWIHTPSAGLTMAYVGAYQTLVPVPTWNYPKLTYFTDAMVILSSGSAIGTFQYLAIDGGWSA